ncbi:MAG: hypothetical protein Q4C78_00520 [Synergistaceae bacterium]|nr:hypothetical protein [Synergistaceae bacterium]
MKKFTSILLIFTVIFTSHTFVPKTYAASADAVQASSTTPPPATQKVTPLAIPKADTTSQQNVPQAQSQSSENTDTSQTQNVTSSLPPITKNLSTENEVKIAPTDQNAKPAFEILDRVETIVYGNINSGGLIERLHSIETVVFGRELPGSITERQTSLLAFLEKSMGSQPSLLFKTSIAEWALEQKIHPSVSLIKRIENLEVILNGNTNGGAILPRLEKIYSQLLPEGITLVPVELPKGTIVKAKLTQTITVRTVKKGDIIALTTAEPIMIGDVLVAPIGSRILGHVTKVRLPGAFGRSSKIDIEIDTLEILGPSTVKLGIGTEAKKATEAYLPMAGAAATSLAGALLLGPVGLVGGFFIRGNDRQLKEGTVLFVNTEDTANALGYKIPTAITPIVTPNNTIPQGSSTVTPQPQK